MQLIPVAATPPLARILCNYASGAPCVHAELGWDTRTHHLCNSCRSTWHQWSPQCDYFICSQCSMICEAVMESSSAGSHDESLSPLDKHAVSRRE